MRGQPDADGLRECGKPRLERREASKRLQIHRQQEDQSDECGIRGEGKHLNRPEDRRPQQLEAQQRLFDAAFIERQGDERQNSSDDRDDNNRRRPTQVARHRDAVKGRSKADAGKNETQLASIFGAEFARGVFESEAQQWSNPVRSAYGWHLVWPHNIQLPVTPPVAEVQDKILARIKQDKEKQVLKQQIEKLKQDYEIIVDVNGDAGAAS